MKEATRERGYRPTESKLKGGAETLYLTYDLEQKTRGGGSALYPKVKRVYIAGEVTGWEAGVFQKRSGREVYGVKPVVLSPSAYHFKNASIFSSGQQLMMSSLPAHPRRAWAMPNGR